MHLKSNVNVRWHRNGFAVALKLAGIQIRGMTRRHSPRHPLFR